MTQPDIGGRTDVGRLSNANLIATHQHIVVTVNLRVALAKLK